MYSVGDGSGLPGPATDVSLNTSQGHSFLAVLTDRRLGDTASFITSLTSKHRRCLTFWLVL